MWVSIAIAILIFAIAVWAIGQLPLPDPFPKALLYVVCAIVLIMYLARYV